MVRDIKWFDSLTKRDFENAATLDEIAAVFANAEQGKRACDLLVQIWKRILALRKAAAETMEAIGVGPEWHRAGGRRQSLFPIQCMIDRFFQSEGIQLTGRELDPEDKKA